MKTKNKKSNIKFFDKEEEKMFESFENNDLVFVGGKKESKMIDFLSRSVKNTLEKKKTISLRISEKDLLKLKAKSLEDGISYQTLVTSAIKKYVLR